MKRMRYEDFTPATRNSIRKLADERGTTPSAVCARFDELFHGNRRASGRGKPDPIFGGDAGAVPQNTFTERHDMNRTPTLDPELLAEEINRFTLAKITPATVRILKTPDEIRREAEKKWPEKFRQYLLDKADGCEEVTLTTPGTVEIDEAQLRQLEDHIRQYWTMRQIVFFHPFLHGGKFVSSSGWERTHSGVVTQTAEEDAAIARLFEELYRSCYAHVGAASVLNMNDARLFRGYAFSDEGDAPSVWDFTLNALRDKMPEGLKSRLDKATKTIERERDDARNRQSGTTRRVTEQKNAIRSALQEIVKGDNQKAIDTLKHFA